MYPEYQKWSTKTPMISYLKHIRRPKSNNRELVDEIWKCLIIAGDIRLKNDLRRLYFALWGDHPPYCYVVQKDIDVNYEWDNTLYDRDLIKNSMELAGETIPRRNIMRIRRGNALDDIPKSRLRIPRNINRKRKGFIHDSGATKVMISETPLPMSNNTGFQTITPQQSMEEDQMMDEHILPQFSKEIKEELETMTTTLRSKHGVLPNNVHLRETDWLGEMHFSTNENQVWVIQVRFIKDLHTSKVIYNRLPFPPTYIQKTTGLKWFKLKGLTASRKKDPTHPDAIYPEKQIHQARCKQQIAYWINGQSVLIGYDKTANSNNSKYSVFFEKCNYFADFLHTPKMLNRIKHFAHFYRCQRVLLSIPKFDLICDLDIYDTPVGQKFLETLPFGSALSFSNLLQYFSMQKTIMLSEDEKKTMSTYFSKELAHGELTLWGNHKICMGTGDNTIPSTRSGKYSLLEHCHVFGRIVSNLDILANIKGTANYNPEIFIYERVLKFTVQNDTVPIDFKVHMFQNQVADLLYESFRVSKTTEFKMEVSSTSAFLFIPIPLPKNKFVDPTQDIVSFGEFGLWHEPNRKIGDRVQSLVFPFGDKEGDVHELRLPSKCSLWGSIQRNLDDLQGKLKQLKPGSYSITIECESPEHIPQSSSPDKDIMKDDPIPSTSIASNDNPTSLSIPLNSESKPEVRKETSNSSTKLSLSELLLQKKKKEHSLQIPSTSTSATSTNDFMTDDNDEEDDNDDTRDESYNNDDTNDNDDNDDDDNWDDDDDDDDDDSKPKDKSKDGDETASSDDDMLDF